jgi:type I restriction enzyme M protein
LSPEAAFDEISKILFMKIRYERNPTKHSIFSLKHFEEGETHYETTIRPYLKGEDKKAAYIEFLFRQTKDEFKQDELFEDNEKINIKEGSFKQIVKMLEIYNLSETSEDIKGIAFEGFLGRTFRGELGQFFTPRTVVDFIVELLDPQEKELVCDPCCGSGGFLIKAFEHIRELVEEDIDKQKDLIKKKYLGENLERLEDEKANKKVEEELLKLNEELVISKNKEENLTRLDHLSRDCIYGTDANPRMARVSKMNMIMHGDGHGGVHHNDGLLNVNGIFENRFDVIVTNPPFGARVDSEQKIQESDKYTNTEKIDYYTKRYGDDYKRALKQVEDNIGRSIVDLYKVGQFSGLTEVLFIERCLNLLKPNGRMGIVLPEGVFNSANLEKVRKFFERKAKIILIVSLPQEVFSASKATVKTSILFMRKFNSIELEEIRGIEEKVTNEYDLLKINALKEIEDVDFDIERIKNMIKERMAQKREVGADKESIQLEINEWKIMESNQKNKKVELKKEITKKLKELDKQMEVAIESAIKNELDYEIPIAEIDKAGIDSTGKKIENQLPMLLEEFKAYRTVNGVW